MGLDRSTRALFGLALGGLSSLLIAGGLVGIRGAVDNVNVALVLVLIVVAAGIFGGRTAGSMSGLVAATAFDFFHTRPYGSLKVARADDLLTTFLLLVVGLVVGELGERSRHFRERLRDDQRQLRRLHRVARLAASDRDGTDDLVLAVSAELVDTLSLVECTFEPPPFLSELPQLQPDGSTAGATFDAARTGFRLPSKGVDLRVVGPTGTVGRFVLLPRPDASVSTEQLLVAAALAHELGLAFAAAATT